MKRETLTIAIALGAVTPIALAWNQDDTTTELASAVLHSVAVEAAVDAAEAASNSSAQEDDEPSAANAEGICVECLRDAYEAEVEEAREEIEESFEEEFEAAEERAAELERVLEDRYDATEAR